MVFFVAALVVALLIVPLTKGSFQRLSRLQFRLLWLLLLALILQFALEVVDFPEARIDDVGFALLMLSYAMILGWCFLNRRVGGMAIIAFGIFLNIIVIAANQGMPTKDDVVTRAGREVHVPIEHTVKHKPEEESDNLGFLGDKLSLPRVPNEQFSIGDIVICLGIIDLCFEASRVPKRRGIAVTN